MVWNKAWACLSVDYQSTVGRIGEVTQRTSFMNNIDGLALQLVFSNRLSSAPLALEAVTVAVEEEGRAEKLTPVTFAGGRRLVLAPGEEAVSDEIPFVVRAGRRILVSCYVREEQEIRAAATTWSRESWHTVYKKGGDFTEEAVLEGVSACEEVYPAIAAAEIPSDVVIGLTEIRVKSERRVAEVALFGDSITHMSYYCDALARRLYAAYPGGVSVTNRGLGGNRLLRDASFIPDVEGHGACAGPAGISRFERDVYGSGDPEVVCVLEGTNDLMHPFFFDRPEELPEPEELLEGLKQLAETAHAHGSRIFFGTVPPMLEGTYAFGEEGERRRLLYNDLIRSGAAGDGVTDFAAVTEDPERPGCMREGLHIGDGLHPNHEGGEELSKITFGICAGCIRA